MKHLLRAALLLCFCAGALRAQDKDSVPPLIKDTSWKASGFFGLNFSQTALSDWQGGGQPNVTVGAIVNLQIIYRRDAYENWLNKLDGQFGMIRPGFAPGFRKNIDQLFYLSKYSTRAFGKHWFWSGQIDYRTQFGPGYNYAADTIVGRAVSDLNAPGYLQWAIGLTYRPVEYFSAMVAPLAGKATFVNRQYLADAGAFGVPAAIRNEDGDIVRPGRRSRYESGGRITVRFKKDVVKNVNIDSYLDLFTNYFESPGNFDVIFNNLVTMKISRFFTVNIISQMLYDDDVKIQRDWDRDGRYESEGDINGPRLQLLTTLSVGFGYKF